MGAIRGEISALDVGHNPSLAHPDDWAIARIRAEFVGYRIWRAVRKDGSLGEWVASLHDPTMGVDPTVMRPTAEELRAALVEEGQRAGMRARFR
ncbi:hypothetical protein E1264_15585 [Actinomadura sp. KC216]|uniref:hypothetical protein n=1 Tax=Actinomadura sp. KC216 TaxID=2530370 RepID=UPI001053BA4B|nr:hypothetical protein [Actinomadura sp. KC216]TDB87124.1 hypothetical protein E1264_15585 [Actinomadura sp. KC216]